MPNLLDLKLRGKDTDFYPLGTISFAMLESWSCPQLRYLELDTVGVTEEKKLVHFLKTHTLQSFTMGTLELENGSWVSVLDSIRNCEQRPQHIIFEGDLVVHEVNVWYKWYKKDKNLRGRIENYLNFGGINPVSHLNESTTAKETLELGAPALEFGLQDSEFGTPGSGSESGSGSELEPEPEPIAEGSDSWDDDLESFDMFPSSRYYWY